MVNIRITTLSCYCFKENNMRRLAFICNADVDRINNCPELLIWLFKNSQLCGILLNPHVIYE